MKVFNKIKSHLFYAFFKIKLKNPEEIIFEIVFAEWYNYLS